MKRRQFVGAGLSLAGAWPLRGFTAVLKGVGDVAAKALDGTDLTLAGSSVEAFAASLRGDVLMPGAGEYDSRRRVWNAMFDRKPALIACCTGAADVQAAVNFAREHRLLTAVRAGGHSFSGKSTCEGGLVIDLQSMQGVRVDPFARRAYVESGSLLGLLDRETAAHGLVVPAGIVSHTGAAGLTLGGGFGRLGRRFGLSCDNVLSFDIVSADGRFQRASAKENVDLFWGLRGGGGNFGVVTSIEYRAQEMNPVVFGGYLSWPISKARDVMRYYRDLMPTLPESMWIELLLLWGEKGAEVAMEVCSSGDHAQAEALLKPLRAFAKPAFDDIAPLRHVDMQTFSDESLANGQYYYAKNAFLRGLTDEAIEVTIDVFRREERLFLLFFDPADGAYRRVAPDASAFPNRDAMYWLGLVAKWKSRDGTEEKIERIRAAWREIEPMTRGFYTNLADADESTKAYRDNYGANFERLVGLKAKYDPMNLFRLNANVKPA